MTLRRYLTVQLPVYVTLAFPAGVGRWTSVEHRSQVQLTFAYGSVHWTSTGLRTDNKPRGKVVVKRLSIGRDGRLTVYITSKAYFHGML